MSEFKEFKIAIDEQFKKMSEYELFHTTASKDELWDLYLDSFPPGTNEIYKERREYDCQCCRQFIRTIGNVIAVIDGKKVSIWDVELSDPTYAAVVKELKDFVRRFPIESNFLHFSKDVGTDYNLQELENGEVHRWNHFHVELPNELVMREDQIGSAKSKVRSGAAVARRGLEEITMDAIETVMDLINQNSIYRGAEKKSIVIKFLDAKKKWDKLTTEEQRDCFAWTHNHLRTRNDAIGTLLTDISDGVELNKAVGSFESKVAPENYKRTSAVITPLMIKNAEAKVDELGIAESLPRRYANIDDITINNVLYADSSAKQAMSNNVFDDLQKDVKIDTKKFNKVEDISVDDFVKNVVPTADTIELLVENKHSGNFVSLVAPVNSNAPNMLQWNNNFTWSYNGEVTDSIQERVKAAGGNIKGHMRVSLQWNEDKLDNSNDLDLHTIEPNGHHIMYSRMRSDYTGGALDVDNTYPNRKTAVENIVWTNKSRILNGKYKMFVKNFSGTNTKGFRAQVEVLGEVYEYNYDMPVRVNCDVEIATVNWNKTNPTIKHALKPSSADQTIWNINTNSFHKVKAIMNSPNHWDGQEKGNKHMFFLLHDCVNEEQTRGFYNEFLNTNLREHRKVFEVLSAKMKVPHSADQLSGVGFSSTQRNSVVCKVTGSFNRTLKINF